MELCSIASGSSGNCIYAGTENTKLLVDVGISCKRIEKGLYDIDVNPEKLDGILVTHEHMDHVQGLGVMARRYHLPIYATAETFCALGRMKNLGKMDSSLFHSIEAEVTFVINDIKIKPFSISHDAADPVAYTLESQGHKIGIATDMGKYDETIVDNLKDSEILLLEANHDINMLQVGKYPYVLKRRILGDLGHLSNDSCGRLINQLLHGGLKQIFLGHLSKENNYPELAYETVRYELSQSGSQFQNVAMQVAEREHPSVLCKC